MEYSDKRRSKWQNYYILNYKRRNLKEDNMRKLAKLLYFDPLFSEIKKKAASVLATKKAKYLITSTSEHHEGPDSRFIKLNV